MRWAPFLVTSCFLGALSGCGETPSFVPTKVAPTGGSLVRLPKDRGFVALKTESPAKPGVGKGRNRPLSVVAYFYKSDGSTPMSPAPTEVVFKQGEGQNAKPINLVPDASDPNRFASDPGHYPRGLQGTIRAKIDGESVEESFSSQ
ncbi:hypothetical protein [Singulisphaera sp. PoT]|uniref:hypothetical protein n=1 Tax=Singulisphaera sp. PoT TaxID=3411797 RepID=UPI003BF60EC7